MKHNFYALTTLYHKENQCEWWTCTYNSPFGFNSSSNGLNRLIHDLQSLLLIQSHAGHHIHRRCNELDLHWTVCGSFLLPISQGSFDRIDAFIGETSNFNICADLDWLGCKTSFDVCQQVGLNSVRNLHSSENIRLFFSLTVSRQKQTKTWAST